MIAIIIEVCVRALKVNYINLAALELRTPFFIDVFLILDDDDKFSFYRFG